MSVLLALVVLALPLGALAAVVLPPVMMLAQRRLPPVGLAAWVGALASSVAWQRAWSADFDRADATGAAGNGLAGTGWVVLAIAAGAVSVAAVHRRASSAG